MFNYPLKLTGSFATLKMTIIFWIISYILFTILGLPSLARKDTVGLANTKNNN